MEKFLGSFSLSLLLRSVFSGAFFTLSYCIAKYGFIGLEAKGIVEELPLSLVAGVSIYGLHRSVVFPIIEWALNTGQSDKLRKCCPLISRKSKAAILKRWGRWAKTRDEYAVKFAEHVCNWADYAHFQYSSALCIVLGSVAGKLCSKGPVEFCWPLFWLTFLFFAAGLISDWRLHAIENKRPVSTLALRLRGRILQRSSSEKPSGIGEDRGENC